MATKDVLAAVERKARQTRRNVNVKHGPDAYGGSNESKRRRELAKTSKTPTEDKLARMEAEGRDLYSPSTGGGSTYTPTVSSTGTKPRTTYTPSASSGNDLYKNALFSALPDDVRAQTEAASDAYRKRRAEEKASRDKWYSNKARQTEYADALDRATRSAVAQTAPGDVYTPTFGTEANTRAKGWESRQKANELKKKVEGLAFQQTRDAEDYRDAALGFDPKTIPGNNSDAFQTRYALDDAYRQQIDAYNLSGQNLFDLPQERLKYLNPAEKRQLAYYASKGDYTTANKYIDYITPNLNRRLQEDYSAQQYKIAHDQPIAGVVSNVVAGREAGLAMLPTMRGAWDELRGVYNPVDTNGRAFRAAHTVNDTTQGVGDRAFEAAGGGSAGEVARFFAETGISMAQFASLLPAGGVAGGAAPLLAMGAQSAGQTALETLENGGTATQATQLAIAAGIIEAGTEKVGIDHIFKITNRGKAGLRLFFKDLAPQAVIEGSEEVVSEVANNLADTLIMGDKSQYNKLVNALIANGMTEEQAKGEALFQLYFVNTAKAFAGGALSGAAMGGGAAGVNVYYTSQLEKVAEELAADNVTAEQVIRAAQMRGNKDAQPLAQELAAKLALGEEIAPADIGKLHLLSNRYVTSQQFADAEARLKAEEEARAKAAPATKTETSPAKSAVQESQSQPTAAQNVTKPQNAEDNVAAKATNNTESIESTPSQATGGTLTVSPTAMASKLTEAERAEIERTGATPTIVKEDGKRVRVAWRGENGTVAQKWFTQDDVSYETATTAVGQPQSASASIDVDSHVQTPQGAGVVAVHSGDMSAVRLSDGRVEVFRNNELSPATQNETATAETVGKTNTTSEENVGAKAKTTEVKSVSGEKIKRLAAQKAKPGLTGNPQVLSKGDRKMFDLLAKAVGVEIHFVDSIPATNGRVANGEYVNGHIFISRTAKNPYHQVLAHEITHHFERTAPEKYKELLEEAIIIRSEAEENPVEQYMKDLGLSRPAAEHEVVADFAQLLLYDTKSIKKLLANNADVGVTFWRMMNATFWRLEDKFVEAVAGENYRNFKRVIDNARDLWEGCLLDAGELPAMNEASAEAAEVNEDAAGQFSLVTDKDTLDWLKGQKLMKVYRTMQVIDGELYPPMAAKVKGEDGKKHLVEAIKMRSWYRSDEGLLKPDKNGDVVLDKGNGKTITAAYNPYWHVSGKMIYDQFTSAYKRPNLVVVEGYIPVSELTSGYRAEGAKDPVGKVDWHSGVVASKLKGDKARDVYLSRYFRASRIVPDSEVASHIAGLLEGENFGIPSNVVTPSLRAELEKIGVPIEESLALVETAYRDAIDNGDIDVALAIAKEEAAKVGQKAPTEIQYKKLKKGERPAKLAEMFPSLKDVYSKAQNKPTKKKAKVSKPTAKQTQLPKAIARQQEKRDAGEMLTEAGFNRLYSVHKLDFVKRWEKEEQKSIEATVREIFESGFRGGFGAINLLPVRSVTVSKFIGVGQYENLKKMEEEGRVSKGTAEKYRANIGEEYGKPAFDDVIMEEFAPRKGDTLLLVPEAYVVGGAKVAQGFKPLPYEVLRVTQDYQRPYDLYKAAYRKAESAQTAPQMSRKLTPEQRKLDEDYEAAVERGDMETAQRMVDEAAKAAGYTERSAHGSANAVFTVFDLTKAKGAKAVFLSDRGTAGQYAGTTVSSVETRLVGKPVTTAKDAISEIVRIRGRMYRPVEDGSDYRIGSRVYSPPELVEYANTLRKESPGGVYSLYINPGKMLTVDAKDAHWNRIKSEYGSSTDKIGEWARAHGYDSVLIEHVFDGGFNMEYPSNVFLVFDGNRLKSADPVTYDDDDNVIPLSERFNEEKDDIRFSQEGQDAGLEKTAQLYSVNRSSNTFERDTMPKNPSSDPVELSRQLAQMAADAADEPQYSISSLFSAANLIVKMLGEEAPEHDEDGKLIITDQNGKRVNRVTTKMLNNSGLGAMINFALATNRITAAQARKQKRGLVKLLNMILKAQDAELVWRCAGAVLASAVKSNSDNQYNTTIDFTTVCNKTIEMIRSMSKSMVDLERGLSKDEIVELQGDLVNQNGIVNCPVCYVFSRWAGIGGLLDNMAKWQKKYADSKIWTPEALEKRIQELRTASESKDALRNYLKKYDNEYMEYDHQLETTEESIEDAKAQIKKLKSDKSALEKEVKDAEKKRGQKKTTEEEKAALDERITNAKKEIASVEKSIAALTKTKEDLTYIKESIKKEIADLEKLGNPEAAWLERVRTQPGYKPVPHKILFNLEDSATMIKNYPLAWGYRTSRGPAMGKAILPYSEWNLGDFFLGVGKKEGDLTFADIQDGKFTETQRKKIEATIGRVMAQNLIGGQRFQSTSDFRYDYALDYLMSFLELQAVGSNIQTYTKVIEYAEILASIGGDVNLSVMPLNSGLDENGNLIYSDVTGINYEAAKEMSARYDNAQLILVGINDAHINAALRDDDDHGGRFVGFVIPYHPSGASRDFIAGLLKNLSETFDAKFYMNYEPVQGDHEIKIPFENDTEDDEDIAEEDKDDARKARDAAKKAQIATWMDALYENPENPDFGENKPTAEQENALRGRYLRDIRKFILTEKDTGKSSQGKEALKTALPLLVQMKMDSTDISRKSFKQLREIEKKALAGDPKAIKEYKSWGAGVLYDVYNKMWEDKNASTTYGVRLDGKQSKSIMPHEYWNTSVKRNRAYVNGFIFRSYCYNLGLLPRFTGYKSNGKKARTSDGIEYGDFSDNPGYYKTLIDRPMYDNKGNYRAQTPINATWLSNPQEQLHPSYGEKQWWGKYTVNEPTDERMARAERAALQFESVKKAEEGVLADQLFSIQGQDAGLRKLNEQYMAAVKSGASENVLARMVRKAANMAGYTTPKLYHGSTTLNFTAFDPKESDDDISLFATSNRRVARTYSGKDEVLRVSDVTSRQHRLRWNASAEETVSLYNELAKDSGTRVRLLGEDETQTLNANLQTAIDTALANLENAFDEDSPIHLLLEEETAPVLEALYDDLNLLSLFAERALTKGDEADIDGLESAQRQFRDDMEWFKEMQNGPSLLDLYDTGVRYVVEPMDAVILYLRGNLFAYEEKNKDTRFMPSWDLDKLIRGKLEPFTGIYELYGRPGKQLTVNLSNETWHALSIPKAIARALKVPSDEPLTTRDYAGLAWMCGYDSICLKGIHDIGVKSRAFPGAEEETGDIYIFFAGENLKSADPVTYDDDGNVIPLTERFNVKENELRHSIQGQDERMMDAFRLMAKQAILKDVLYNTAKVARWRAERANKANTGAKTNLRPISAVLADISDFLQIQITTGNMRYWRSAAGFFNPRNAGIRIRNADNLSTAIHELGHAIDHRYGIAKLVEADETLKREALKAFSAFPESVQQQYKPEDHVSEGLAEYMRLFLSDRQSTEEEFPELTKLVLGKLSPRDLAVLDQIADEVNAIMLNTDTAGNAIRFAGEETKLEKAKRLYDAGILRDVVGDRIRNWWNEKYQSCVDSNHAIKRFDRDTGSSVYRFATNAAYSDARAKALIERHLYDFNGNYIGPGLADSLRGVDIADRDTYRAFGEYLVVKHGPERLAEEMDVFSDPRKNNVEWMKKREATLAKEHPEFVEAAEKLYQFQRDFLKAWGVRTNLVSAETAKEWGERWQHYVPFQRYMGDQFYNTSAKRGFANQKSPYNTARGSTRDIIHPVDSIINNIIRNVNVSVRNDVFLRIAQYVERKGANALWLEKIPPKLAMKTFNLAPIKEATIERLWDIMPGDVAKIGEAAINMLDDLLVQYGRGKAFGNVVTVLRNGKPEFYQINDPLLLDSLTNLAPTNMTGILEAYGQISRFMTANLTGLNVVWSIFSNLPRDIVTARLFAKHHGWGKLITGMAEAYINKVKGDKADPIYLEWLAMGGEPSGVYSADVNVARKERLNLTKGSNTPAAKKAAAKRNRNPIRWLEFISNAIESGPRYATYKALREEGVDSHTAFYESMDITTNFRKSGQTGRQINKVVPFFNAGVQGLDKFFRWISADDAPKGKRLKTVRSRVLMWFAVSAAVAALSYALNHADDEREKDYEKLLSSYTKNNFFIIPLGNHKFFAIPKPREIAVLSSLFERILGATVGKNDKAFYDFYDYFTDQCLPPFISDMAKIPSQGTDAFLGVTGSMGLLGVGVYIGANRDFLNRPITSQSLEKYNREREYTDRTSLPAYWIGQAFKLSPTKLDYFLSQVLGGAWKVTKALLPKDSKNRDWTVGIASSYVKDSLYSTDVVDRLYDLNDKSEKQKNTYPDNIDDAINYKMDDAMLSYYKAYYAMEKEIKDAAKNKSEVEALTEARRTVLVTVSDYLDAVEDDGAVSVMPPVIYETVKSAKDTSLLPDAMKGKIKDADKNEIQLTPRQYVEYQGDYLRRYYELAEKRLPSASDKAETLKQIKKDAKEEATNAILRQVK